MAQWPASAIHMHSQRPARPRAQATIAYVELASPRPERRARLLESYHFDINAQARRLRPRACKCCAPTQAAPAASAAAPPRSGCRRPCHAPGSDDDLAACTRRAGLPRPPGCTCALQALQALATRMLPPCLHTLLRQADGAAPAPEPAPVWQRHLTEHNADCRVYAAEPERLDDLDRRLYGVKFPLSAHGAWRACFWGWW